MGILFLIVALGLVIALYGVRYPTKQPLPISYCTLCNARFLDQKGLVWHVLASHPHEVDSRKD